MGARQSKEMARAIAQVEAGIARGEPLGKLIVTAAHKNDLYTASIYQAIARKRKKSAESILNSVADQELTIGKLT